MEEPVVETTEPVQENPEEVATETPETPKETTEQPKEVTTEAPKDEPYLLKLKVDGEEKVFDLRDENQRLEATDVAQKGFHYSKRLTSLAEVEKANQQKIQFADQLAANQPLIRSMMGQTIAQQMGYDPAWVFQPQQQIDPNLRDLNPELYGKLTTEEAMRVKAQEVVKNATDAYIKQNVQANNTAVYERARLNHNLNDNEYQEVVGFVQSRIRSNDMGMFSESDMDAAVNAVLGKERLAQAKLQTANNIQKTIKAAITSRPSVQSKTQTPTKEVTDATAFKDFVKEYSAR